MARTTRALVSEIIELDPAIVPDDAAMAPFILVANEITTECCTGDAGPTPAYSTIRLELIERWLAAHYYTNRDPRAASEKAGDVSANYQSKVDLGLATSHYGQTAMELDTHGGLARLNKRAKTGSGRPLGYWLGTTDE